MIKERPTTISGIEINIPTADIIINSVVKSLLISNGTNTDNIRNTTPKNKVNICIDLAPTAEA